MSVRSAVRSTFVLAILALLAGVVSSPRTLEAQQDAGTVTGRVVAEEGGPLSGVTVTVEGTELGALTDDRGRFRIRGVPPGARRLTAGRIGHRSRTLEVDVPAGGSAAVEIRLAAAPVELKGLSVIGSRRAYAELRQRMREVPGSVELVEAEELRNTRQANFKDVLRFVPGVYAQSRFGAADESQLSIRGSGLRNNFHLRGVTVLVNGMPYRNADGFTDFESLELLTVENVQVYKGGNAFRYGGSTLGGAINLETKTGHTAEEANLFAQGGAYGLTKFQGSTGQVLGDFNYYASYARTETDGYRAFSHQQRDRINLHSGYRLSDDVDLRTFYFFAAVQEDLPGSLTRQEMREDPRQAAPQNVADAWGRDYDLHHVGLQLRAQLGPDQRLEVSPYGQFRDIVHPIFQVLDQESEDYGAEVRYENTAELAGRSNRLTLGFQPAYGEVDNRHFENVGGERGVVAKDQLDRAATLAFYAEDVFDVTDRLRAVLGLRYDRALREVEDELLSDGDQTDREWMEALLPKAGLIYELPSVDGQLFVNATRLFEPPLLLELNSLTVPGFIDLEPQTAWQFELGTRGRAAGLDWNLSLYDMEIRDEILNINVRPFPDAPFTVPTYRNAPETRHYGLEAGLGYALPGSLFTGADELKLRIAYTLNRFEYTRDPEFEGNDIPGAPKHVLNGEVAYRHPVGLTLRADLEWVPGDYFVDSRNTVRNEGWAILGARAEYELPWTGGTAFLEVRNLTDQLYSNSVTVDDASGRFFEPAPERSVYGGIRWHP